MRFKLPSLGGKEKAILQGLGESYSLVHEAVLEFQRLLAEVAARDAAAASASFQRVLEDEKKADDFQRRLSTQIAEGAFFGGVREDMLNLLEKVDNIADSAKGASRLLQGEETWDEFALSLIASKEMTDFVADVVGTVEALGLVLGAFRSGRKEILAGIPKVEELEEAADARKDAVAKRLFATGQRPDPITVIQMRDFLLVADNIADNAEDASDVVLILVAKGYD